MRAIGGYTVLNAQSLSKAAICMPKPSFVTQDPRGNQVFLYDDRYESHIKYRHPEASIEAILSTIEDPDVITQDFNFSFGENYYACGVLDDDPHSFLTVCVHIKDNGREVVTAFWISTPRQKEQVIWQP